MIRITLPASQATWDERVAFACLPLADGLLALYLLANGVGSGSDAGAERLRRLHDRIGSERNRAIRALFDAAFPVGMIAFDLAQRSPGSDDPAALIAGLRALPDAAIVAHALACGGSLRADAPRSPGALRSLVNDPAWAMEYVQRFLSPVPSDPAKIVEVITHPARTRERLADLLADLCDDLFAPLLPELRAAGRSAEARMRDVYMRDPTAFVAANLPNAAPSARGVPRLLVWPSVFLGDGWATISANVTPSVMGDVSVHSVAYGADMLLTTPAPDAATQTDPAEIVPEIAPPETYQDVYRLLADPARWTLIQLLVTAPRYGQELAELLGLSIATVSHHLNGLKKLDLVDIKRDEHRLYYHLRTDRLRALLAGAEQRLLM